MTHWFTADPHFGHDAIIRHCKRPFDNVQAMDAHLLNAYRETVEPEDDLWIVGDFAFARGAAERQRAADILDAIPGRKHLVAGNHDRPWIRNLPWASVHDMWDFAVEGQRLFLCHYPMITFPGARRKSIQLFGHVHGNWQGTRNSVNVGVDVWGFRPVSTQQIVTRAMALSVNAYWDEVEPGRVFPST
ncbi:metallophosphoesterase [Falsirhodobacter sp. 1013]|uniref:metallophosphoesterase n=1 Tax=Falsirhodobacter sp. 1013 TaxID=3417566 RepID=UPI003EB9C2BD